MTANPNFWLRNNFLLKVKISFDDGKFEPLGLDQGIDLSQQLTIQNSPVLFGCRTGICGTCLIQVKPAQDASIEPPSDEEKELLSVISPGDPNARLACQLKFKGSICIRIAGKK